MATFDHDQAPASFEWTTQWKTWLANLVRQLQSWTRNPEATTLVVDSDVVFRGNVLVEGALEVEEDLAAEDAAFGGEITVAEDVTAGGTIDGENSPYQTAPITLSGAAISLIDNIPSWVRRVTITWDEASTNGTSSHMIQLGTASGLVTSAYSGSGTHPGAAELNTSGFRIMVDSAAALRHTGRAILELHNPATNFWILVSTTGRSDSARVASCAGGITLPGSLTQITMTTVGGVNTWDSGTARVRWEY